MDVAEKRSRTSDHQPLIDGALDTLDCIFRTAGSESFQLDSEGDPHEFRERCMEIAQHIENGSAAPQLDIPQADAGTRNWSKIRRFYIDRRREENSFVSNRLHDYRGVVEGLIGGLQQICEQGNTTEQRVITSLNTIEDAVERGQLPEIERALATAIKNVSDAFIEQKHEYENQIRCLNERMSGLREDLVAAHEEMKVDSLTGVCNRGAFDAAITRCLNVNFVLSQQISMIMIDIDNFKSINDTFGHTIGDQVLKSVAVSLSRAFIRKDDLIARYGGDEFAVLLPNTSAEKSEVSINRFLTNVRRIKVDGLPDDITVSCSAGCTELVENDNADSLLARADAALYEAKEAGRNCLRVRRAASPE